MYKGLVLIRHLEFNGGLDELRVDRQVQLHFPTFVITKVRHWREVEAARRRFPQANRGDLIFEKNYDVASFHDVQATLPFDLQDILLLLRLYKPGDIAFVELKIEEPTGNLLTQPRYWATGDSATTLPFEFSQNEVAAWSEFAAENRASVSWDSTWFRMASRYFLIGGAKEFNTYVEPREVERVLDYIIAIEAILTTENDFVARRVRNRAVSLLHLEGEEAVCTKTFLTKLYEIRSSIAHGDAISDKQAIYLRANRDSMEQIVRRLLVAGLRHLPVGATDRRAALKELYNVENSERAEVLWNDFRKIKDSVQKRDLIDRLQAELK